MFTDSNGNRYAALPSRKPVPAAKASNSNSEGKAGRSKRNGKPFGMNGGCGCVNCR